ncbi:FUSC family protein [Serratia fonticola]|uniref:FUSC family protein n=1 Tax=Serratia fonticola TaxID=47917 RepID=UPI00217BF053|nr:FUSC family protein [Serratia fonticola]CAI1616635.1 multidrug efflux system protein MdtO [Serratia fonticola]CAI1730234.1 multidrug efflux system protein MdtO [Serratia fonticola]CAI1770611.1 multidrug efflux system protein MdtO [Serratia fonticola]
MVADRPWGRMLRQVKRDLAYFPGRLAMAWRVGALCALMTLVAMLYGIPESAISCYLILFVMKPDAAESMAMAIAVTLLVSIVVGLILLIMPYTLESAPLRMAVLVLSSFAFLWLGSASKLGPVGSIIALVIAFIMSLLGDAPNGELAVRAVLYAWLMAASPMLLLVAFNLFIGRPPWKLLRASLAERLEVAGAALRHPDASSLGKVEELLREGQSEHQQRAMLVRIFHLRPAAEAAWLTAAVNSSYQLLLAISALNKTVPALTRPELADWCSSAAEAITAGRVVEPPAFNQSGKNDEVTRALVQLATPDNAVDTSAPKASFLAADAFTNPVHQQFAIKTTAASVICYLVYTALDWQDIHTAMITCYVAALGTAGETVHKLTLRIVGCLIGALMGVLSLIFIVPSLSDIGQLMALVFGALLLSAWVSSGNERIAYAGIQIGLAFLLTVLHGFSPSTDLGVALDRVLGILLGNLVVYLIFTYVWPVAIADFVRTRIRSLVTGLSNLAALAPTDRPAAIRQAAEVEEELTTAREALRLVPFEPRSLRPSPEEYRRLQAILGEMENLCPALFLPFDKSSSDVERLRRLSSSDGVINPSVPTGSNNGLPPAVELEIQQSIRRLEELLG